MAMPDHISIRKAPGIWVVRTDGAVIAESREALELSEGSYPKAIYFPRADIAMAMLDPSPTSSICPWKGKASYFSLVTGDGTILDAAWSYETPIEGMEQIAGHLAFHPDKATVEQI